MHKSITALLPSLAIAAFLGVCSPGLAQNTGVVPDGPVGLAFQWSLVFEDNFASGSVDQTKWSPSLFWGITSNGSFENLSQLEWYFPANSTVANGVLTIQARRENTATSYGVFNYTSGLITTDRNASNVSIPVKFDFLYGYAEIRAKLPAGKGLWPAFWMLPSDQTASEEIDILEVLGDHPATNYMTYHWGSHQSTGGSWTTSGADYSQGYHTFAVDWTPAAIVWYVDGVERQRVSDASIISRKRMDLIANLQIGGAWAGSPDASTAFPANYDIDYIRVWKKGAAIPPPATNNLLLNSSFENGSLPWSLDVKTGASATYSRDTTTAGEGSRSALVKVTRSSSVDWYVQLVQSKVPLVQNRLYVVTFMAKAETARPISVVVQKTNSPYTEYSRQSIALKTEWTQYSFVFTAPFDDVDSKLSFSLGGQKGKVWVDRVSLGY
jgi:beta-glucanase (GH16 family)